MEQFGGLLRFGLLESAFQVRVNFHFQHCVQLTN